MILELPNHGWRRRFAFLPFTLPNGPTKTLVWWQTYWSRNGGECTEVSLSEPADVRASASPKKRSAHPQEAHNQPSKEPHE